jgi:hypothetical protein
MTVKLHLFSGFSNPQRGITADMELGHLYSDVEDREELLEAGRQLGMAARWIQGSHTGMLHFDLWHGPLQRAKGMYQIVDDEEFSADLEKVRRNDR